jgi:transposase
MTVMLKRQGLAVNTKRVRRLMHELGITAAAPKRKPRTTESQHPYPRFANLVEGLKITRPEQV